MKKTELGWACLIIGLILGVYAFTMDTSVEIDYSNLGGNPYHMPDRVNNFGLMNTRSNLLIAAGVLCIGGFILIAMGTDSPATSKPIPETTPELEMDNYEETDFVADELLKLHELKEKGALTIDEFNAQKAKLLT